VLLTDTELDTLLVFDTDTVFSDDTLGLIDTDADALGEPMPDSVCNGEIVGCGDAEVLGDMLAEDDNDADDESVYDIVFSPDAV
jgi:hypothetical protein